jgi:hypothetical protein
LTNVRLYGSPTNRVPASRSFLSFYFDFVSSFSCSATGFGGDSGS